MSFGGKSNSAAKEVKKETKETVVQKTQNNSKNSTTAQTKIDIGPVNINNAIFSFEDKNLPLPFKTTITKLNGKISEFKKESNLI